MKELKETRVMLDLNPEHAVEICIQEDGEKVWINVDGLCRMRLTALPSKKPFILLVEDHRRRQP